MGFFGKKKAGKKEAPTGRRSASNTNGNGNGASAASRQRAATPKQPPAAQKKVIKIVGDEKHVTTTTTDAAGRVMSETTITKLTPTERLQHQPNSKPPQAQQKAPPPAVYQPPPAQEQPPIVPPPSMDHLKPPSSAPQYYDQQQQQQQQYYDQQQQQQQQHQTQSSNPPASVNSSHAGSSVTNLPVGNESLATIEITRDLVKRFISDIWNRGEIELIPEVCHPSLRFNGHVGMDRVGHDGFARMVTTVRDALTDYHCEIHSMVVETNKAFCRLRFTGKHTGVLLGFPPTGKTVAWMGASEFTCKNGKILKVWELGDVKSLEEQLKNPN